MAELSELIAKLEGLSGPSSDVEKAILRHFGFTWRGMAYRNNAGEMWKGPTFFTHSIDAAVALVERKLPDAVWDVSTTGRRPGATVSSYERKVREGAYASTPAVALVLALLRALSSEQGNE